MLTLLLKIKRNILSLLYALGAVVLVSAMMIWPQQTYEGARFGLNIWLTILVPSLFPFFIIAEILLNLGVVNFLGVLLEPVMRPLFNLPGTASFVIAMGFTSGFPMGAVMTKRLCEEKCCTLAEGERLVAFTNNSSPLFILVAVAVGMFNNPGLGLVLAVSHYTANIILGIILGFLSPGTRVQSTGRGNIMLKSIRALLHVQRTRKPWGQLLGDSIRNSINTMALIGGFVIIFAVIIKVLTVSMLIRYLTSILTLPLKLVGFDPSAGLALATGFFEMTLGLKESSLLASSIQEKAAVAGMLLGWSGLSIQAQVTSILSGSGIRPYLYYWGRIFQSLLGGVLAYFLAATPLLLSQVSVPAFSWEVGQSNLVFTAFHHFTGAVHMLVFIFSALFILSLIVMVWDLIRRLVFS
jgi:sporulation integral membrane protein YlbJ